MKIGIIVGRFQTHTLTIGHKQLLQETWGESDKVLILIGVTPVRNTLKEPLSYEMREAMISDYIYRATLEENNEKYEIQPINTIGNLPVWCAGLDSIIDDHINKNNFDNPEVLIYGGRDSVTSYYQGKYPTKEIETKWDESATKVRAEVFEILPQLKHTMSFRAGVVYASQWRFPTGYPTIDVACINGNGEILLGKKPNRDKYQLIGGFFDPTIDETLEQTALRELYEETGVVGDNLKYVCSSVIKTDYRYINETDKIITTFFRCDYSEGDAKANDDIVETIWMDLIEVLNNVDDLIVPGHRELIKKLG